MRLAVSILLAAVVFMLPLSAASVDGITIHSSLIGSDKKTMIFVHGWTCDSSSWDGCPGPLGLPTAATAPASMARNVVATSSGRQLALTITTVAVSKLELGEYNFIAAMTIAIIKGTLVVMFFMDVRHATSMTKLFVGAGLCWLAILIVFLLSDYLSRGWLPSLRWL